MTLDQDFILSGDWPGLLMNHFLPFPVFTKGQRSFDWTILKLVSDYLSFLTSIIFTICDSQSLPWRSEIKISILKYAILLSSLEHLQGLVYPFPSEWDRSVNHLVFAPVP